MIAIYLSFILTYDYHYKLWLCSKIAIYAGNICHAHVKIYLNF